MEEVVNRVLPKTIVQIVIRSHFLSIGLGEVESQVPKYETVGSVGVDQ